MRTRVFVSLLVMMPLLARADSVRTLDGKVTDGKAAIDAAGVAVTPKGQNQPVKVPFSQLLRARFDSTDAVDTNETAERWNALDIGEASQPGSNKQNKQQITVETAGTDIAGRADSCRLVYQPVRGNSEVSVKVTGAGQWREKTAAGVMMRATSDPASQSMALLISRDAGLYFVARGNAGNDSVVTQIGRMKAPLFLRLVREGTYVKAYRSPDGKLWIKVAEARTDLGPEALAGAVATSREAGMSAPVFDNLRVGSDDVPGSTSTDLAEVRSASKGGKGQNRPDNHKRISVNSSTTLLALPDAATHEVKFELDGKYNMLSGQAYIADHIKGGGGATFQIFGDDEKLFDSGKLSSEAGATSSFHVPVAGRRELRLVVIDNGGGKIFAAGGIRNAVLQSFKPAAPVPKSQFAQVVTTDGASYAGVEIRSVTAEAVQFSRGQRRDLSVPTERVARVVMPGFSPDMIDRIPASGSGVMLLNGDFYEGDVEKLDGAKVQVNSVIFGPREFPIRGGDVQAIILRPVATDPPAAAFEVTTTDGSLLPAASLSSENGQLAVNDRNLGKLLLDAKTVREIRYGGDRLKWIADMRPRRVSPGPGRSAAESFVIDATPLGQSLRLLDIDYERGVSLAAGTSVSYDIDGRYNSLLCVGGVPAEVLPTTTVVFVVEADGKEVFRSPPRSSVQDPLPITANTTGVKSLTLRVEGASASPLPAIALWADPLLIKSSP